MHNHNITPTTHAMYIRQFVVELIRLNLLNQKMRNVCPAKPRLALKILYTCGGV